MKRFDDGIRESLEVDMSGDGDIEVKTTIVQDNIPTISQNDFDRIHGNNGFSKERTMRKVASIPLVADIEAKRLGYNLCDKGDLYRFLAKYPQFMTVNGIDTGHTGRVVLK